MSNGVQRIPRGVHAIVDIAKIHDYCLNFAHERGKHKARVFAASLGIYAKDAQVLQQALLRACRDEKAIPIVRANEDFPRLTTCYVL
jgi:hypothetical protein